MKKVRKGYISILICFMLLTFFNFTGCKKDETNPTGTVKKSTTGAKASSSQSSTKKSGTSTGSPTTSKGSTTSTENEEFEGDVPAEEEQKEEIEEGNFEDLPAEEKIDFGGRVVEIAQSVAIAGDWVLNPDNPLSVMEFASVDDVEQKYNCKINVKRLTAKQVTEGLVNAALAGLKFCDVARRFSYEALPTHISQDLIIPIDEYVDGKGYEERYKGIDFNNGASFWTGKRYGFVPTKIQMDGTGLIFNKTIFDKEGLAYPHQAYWDGTWDWNMMLDFALKTTKDFNGDGITDQWGLMTDPSYYLLYSNGGNIVTFNESWEPQYGFDTVSNIRAINFVVELVNTYKVVDIRGGLKFQDGNHAMWCAGANNCFGLRVAKFEDFGFVAIPKGPDVDRYISAIDTEAVFYITRMVDNGDIQSVIQILLDYLSVDEYEPYNMSIPEQRQSKVDVLIGEEKLESQKIWYDLYSKTELVYTNFFTPLKSRTSAVIINPTIKMTTPLISAIDSFRPEALTILESYK